MTLKHLLNIYAHLRSYYTIKTRFFAVLEVKRSTNIGQKSLFLFILFLLFFMALHIDWFTQYMIYHCAWLFWKRSSFFQDFPSHIFSNDIIMVTEQLYWRKAHCGCFGFLWLWLLIAITKKCAERYALQLYRTSLMEKWDRCRIKRNGVKLTHTSYFNFGNMLNLIDTLCIISKAIADINIL